MNYKEYHKELKKQVNEVEDKRNNDRSSTTWYQQKRVKET